MRNKKILLLYINDLADLAQKRDTEQGGIVYKRTIEKLNELNSQIEINKLIEEFKKFLSSVEAHGYFTDDEYRIVNAIRQLN